MIVIVGVAAWALALAVCALFLRRAIYSFLEPLVLVSVLSITFSAALLAVLCDTGIVPWSKSILFWSVLLGYLIGARLVCGTFQKDAFRDAIIRSLSGIRYGEITVILAVTAAVTFVLAVLGMEMGAAGDARQTFTKELRPVVLLQSGLFDLSIVLLLSKRLTATVVTAWLLVLVVLEVPYSGKGVMVPVLYWYGLKLFLARERMRLGSATVMATVAFASIGVMGIIAYGVSDMLSFFMLPARRLWLMGDVYLDAYQSDALSSIRDHYHVSFLAYIFHPLTSLIGIRGYDKPLGAMISSEISNSDILTGPNPQLPVVLDYFFPEKIASGVAIALIIGFFALSFRPMSIWLSRSRSRYVRVGGIAAAILCPAAGFLDTSLVFMSLVGIVAATAIAVFFEMTLTRNRSGQIVEDGAFDSELIRRGALGGD